MLAGKISSGKKKFSRCNNDNRRRRRKRRSRNIIVDYNQKHRNISSGKNRGGIQSFPSSNLPPLCWSSSSLMCHLSSKHSQKETCLESSWKWSKPSDQSIPTLLLDHNQEILFHPRTSSSTQVILADRPLPTEGKHFWEIYVPAVYGTSMMFGIATREQKLTSSSFTNLIGIDQHGWALSHHGLLWHNGKSQPYLSRPLEALRPFLIGLEFDSNARTLSYSIDNQFMGVAFSNIPTNVSLYPAVSSTSAQSMMILKHRCKTCSSLRDSCLKKLRSINWRDHLDQRVIPRHLIEQMNN